MPDEDEPAAVWVETEKLLPWVDNPRANDEAVDDVVASIQEFGFGAPILARAENCEIIAGHTRLKAALRLGLERVPVRFRDLTSEQAHALAISDNKTGERATWLDAGLREQMKIQLARDDAPPLAAMGFDEKSLSALMRDGAPPPSSENTNATPPKNPITKKGDLWTLGEHLLLCGSAFDAKVVELLTDKHTLDLGFHDPPYGINWADFVGGGGKLAKHRTYEPVKGDDQLYDPTHLLGLTTRTIIWGANNFHDLLPRSGAWLVWDKGRPEGTCFSDVELAWTDADVTRVPCYRVVWNGMIREGESGPRVHPNQKPLKLCAQIISDHSQTGATVLDFFGGSGSTLIACEHVGRLCRTVEISAGYCDVIVERWQQLTGGKAKRAKG